MKQVLTGSLGGPQSSFTPILCRTLNYGQTVTSFSLRWIFLSDAGVKLGRKYCPDGRKNSDFSL
jgi:hypothetical protein